jgi:hypothetical protein
MLASVADIYGDSRQGGSVGSFVHGSWTRGLQKWISARCRMWTLDAIDPRVILDCLASLSENLTLLDERAVGTCYRVGICMVLSQGQKVGRSI